MTNDLLSLAYAHELDRSDPLAHFRNRFVVADPELIYLDGNSLGRLPRATVALLRDGVDRQWGERLIRGWNDGWMELSQRIGDKIGQLIGAQPGEVILADSTSTNLYKLASAACQARPGRGKIVTDDLNFPSDLYVLQGICAQASLPCRLEGVASADGIHGPADALLDAINEDTALVALSPAVFKSSYVYDMGAITARAHEVGALVLWDLSHAVGSVPVDLAAAHADLAVGCTYKYLNGGPGAPAFLYVREGLQAELRNPIQGWMGQAELFDFGLTYQPASGILHFLTGTPPVLSASAVEPGVDLLLEAGMDAVRAKSVAQSEWLIELWDARLAPLGFTLKSPRDPAQRGSHVSLGHAEGWRIAQTLINDLHVLPDFRKPDNIRLGIAPLYNSYVEVYEAVARLEQTVVERLYERHSPHMAAVT
mgnify:CR=1 FL=1